MGLGDFLWVFLGLPTNIPKDFGNPWAASGMVWVVFFWRFWAVLGLH
jgi:hypothetical protein